ncbi:hypothetical protein [Sphingomonas qomolangmaensis]|uniref:DUF3077 domain-containing protein n=1 Tax=Sphingomonas qomolangmaensis TaxID=2918765 RepID=A0ABY5L5J9_9SPHN|nr:hypothetical protein [Sphingomonas qomolangmaensis]UUL82225.1 hypothetical protein NMP03_13715 [Sphingomonas qomolangmaensis]
MDMPAHNAFNNATPAYRLNGVIRDGEEPLVYIEQASAVAYVLEEGCSEDCGMNLSILRAAAQAIQTLTHLAAEAIDRQERAVGRR